MTRTLPALVLLLFTACGLADDPRDEDNKYVYITFSDRNFETYCLSEFDLNGDGRISRYEAQRVLEIACPSRDIGSLWEIGEFSRLRRLDCSDNKITQLDLHGCTDLRTLDCSGNGLEVLDIDGLRGLTRMDCADNRLERLDLKFNGSLSQLDCRLNRLVTLDLTPCSGQLHADMRGNSSLATVYCLASQGVDYDGQTEVVVR